jgi:hypothetical protein
MEHLAQKESLVMKVMADVCILHPASLRDTYCRLAERDEFECVFTEFSLRELERSLARRGAMNAKQAHHLVEELQKAFSKGLVTNYRDLLTGLPDNLKNHYRDMLAAAIKYKVRIVVTLAERQFPKRVFNNYGILVQTPDEFLVGLLLSHPDVIKSIMEEQAKDLHNPPQTVNKILDNLAKSGAPDYARQFRKH